VTTTTQVDVSWMEWAIKGLAGLVLLFLSTATRDIKKKLDGITALELEVQMLKVKLETLEKVFKHEALRSVDD